VVSAQVGRRSQLGFACGRVFGRWPSTSAFPVVEIHSVRAVHTCVFVVGRRNLVGASQSSCCYRPLFSPSFASVILPNLADVPSLHSPHRRHVGFIAVDGVVSVLSSNRRRRYVAVQ
jgi:hypothetical protein